jgi:putative (di)nucleoside polyphosphate hydrolase
MVNNNLSYRKSVGIILLNNKNKIFVGRRIDKFSKAWQMPQGGIDDNENYHDALCRELCEETSITSMEIIDEYPDMLKYDIAENLRPLYWNGLYKGQMQKWFLCRFIGEENEINIQTTEPEFQEWAWHDQKFILANIVSFKREIYEKIFLYWKKYL